MKPRDPTAWFRLILAALLAFLVVAIEAEVPAASADERAQAVDDKRVAVEPSPSRAGDALAKSPQAAPGAEAPRAAVEAGKSPRLRPASRLAVLALPLAFAGSALLAWALNSVELIPWRRARAEHWTQRARRLYPARASRALNLLLVPCSLALASRLVLPQGQWFLVACCGYAGALLGNYPMDRDTIEGMTPRAWRRTTLTLLLIQLPLGATIAVAAVLMPPTLGVHGWLLVAGVVALQVAWHFGACLVSLRLAGLLHPAPERLRQQLKLVSDRTGVKVRGIWEIDIAVANGLAFPGTGDVAVTRRLLEVCSDDELRAICAHEVGHVSETFWMRTGRLAGGMMALPVLFVGPALAGRPLSGVELLVIAWLILWALKGRFWRAMEVRADRFAAAAVDDPASFARALECLHRASLVPATLHSARRRPHPDLYDRMVAANHTPDYPRPEVPASRGWTGIAMAVVCVGLVYWLLAG